MAILKPSLVGSGAAVAISISESGSGSPPGSCPAFCFLGFLGSSSGLVSVCPSDVVSLSEASLPGSCWGLSSCLGYAWGSDSVASAAATLAKCSLRSSRAFLKTNFCPSNCSLVLLRASSANTLSNCCLVMGVYLLSAKILSARL